MIVRFLILAIMGMMLSSTVWAAGDKLLIEDAYVRLLSTDTMARGAYMRITNLTHERWIMTRAKAVAYEKTGIYEIVTVNGKRKVKKRKYVVINPEETIEFKPDGLQLLLMNPVRRDTRKKFPITLYFRKHSPMLVRFNAR